MNTTGIIALALVGAGLGFAAIGAASNPSPPAADLPPKSAPAVALAQAQGPCTVDKAGYERVRTGSSYRRAVSDLGCEGEEMARSEVAGYRSVVYMWRGRKLGANMNVTFSNGEMVAKAQFGLD